MTSSPRQRTSSAPSHVAGAAEHTCEVLVRKLYTENQYTVNEIAKLLSIRRSHVAATLKAAGVEWRTPRKKCPIDEAQLRMMVEAGTGTPATLARTYGVAYNTAARWLADAGLLPADPGINEDDLRELYVTQQLPTREVAEKLGVNKSRVLRALAAAGIPARPRELKRQRATATKGDVAESTSRTPLADQPSRESS
jgi:DNA invertase Pin-like site-specific DNA recombinase